MIQPTRTKTPGKQSSRLLSPKKITCFKTMLTRVMSSSFLKYCYVSMPMRGYIFVLLLVGDEVLAILEAFDLELVALGPGVNVLDIVYRIC
jgi:hypothetical protein